MAGETGKESTSRITEEMKATISEEVGKALEASLPQFIDRLQTTLLAVIDDKMNEKKDAGKLKACPYNKFMACKPPFYHGEVDPIVCQRWIHDIEGVFERTHFDETDFVAYGTDQLRGQAKDWWNNLKKEQGIEATRTMTWEEFKTPFLRHHSPKAVINRIKEEFIQLRHNGKSIEKITGIFLDKLRFCDELVQNEEQKIYYYYNMLSAEYREFMTPSKYVHLTEIVNAACEREIELKKQIDRGERRAFEKNPLSAKKQKLNEAPKKGTEKGGAPQCKISGKNHKGECYFKNKPCPTCGKVGHVVANCSGKVSVCYKFYKLGHKKSECPELVRTKDTTDAKPDAQKAKARSFHMTAAEAKTKPDVVSGIFLVNSIPARILFDTGANRSFISHRFIQHPTFTLTKLPIPLEVEIGDNKSFIVCDMCWNYKLSIDDEEYFVDLIPMSMGEFQVVIGMDWLA
ncbi:uncharacterized protein LOC110888410 [Helianthus annuus]|uniref:uncharacterized protein LOC110888410 n=1 Tax=Helianthus annuus TaxID=4232 RepID=UPI000B8F7EF9|nr:uncharacterized protein LOC110888410 [Helianthus annuus]